MQDQDPEGKYEALSKYARDLTQVCSNEMRCMHGMYACLHDLQAQRANCCLCVFKCCLRIILMLDLWGVA